MGESIHIGIIDSLGEPPNYYREAHDIKEVHDAYTSSDLPDTANHGTPVLWNLVKFAPRASYSTFQIIDRWEENGEIQTGANRGNTIDAIIDAVDSGVDLLNLSIGIDHDCGGNCNLSRELNEVIDKQGVCAIAAAGNRENLDERPGVHCPAIADSVISVGGYIPRCTYDLVEDDDSNQWWLQSDGVIGPFCGQNGCCNGVSCDDYQYDSLWSGNVSFHNAAPDILAPPISIRGTSLDDIELQMGTSFSVPLVTGILSAIVSDLRDEGITTSIDKLQFATKNAATPIDDDYYKLDAIETEKQIREMSD